MDLRQFRYFIQAARRENFRKASEDLRIAQSPLPRQIQLLESELGFLLFDRVKRGVRLTAAGQRLLERSQHILAEVDRAQGESADRGACAERAGFAGGAALDRTAAVRPAVADLSEILSERAAQPDRGHDLEHT